MIRIWQESRLLGAPAMDGKIQHGVFDVGFGRQRRRPGRIDIDMAGGAGAGPAAIRINAGDAVFHRAFHQGPAGLYLNHMLGAVMGDENDLGHHKTCLIGMALSPSRFGSGRRAFRNPFLAEQIIGRGIDGFHRRHGAIAQVEDGKFAVSRDRRAIRVGRRDAPCRRSAT